MYDPLLKARRNALDELQEELTTYEYEVAEKAVDMYLDKIEDEMGHAKNIMVNRETGMFTITSENECT